MVEIIDALVLHDLDEDDINCKYNNYRVFLANKKMKACIGCFGCWVKTPGKCILKDKGNEFATLMPYAREVIVVSELVFGGMSSETKKILDRSIGFMLPFFHDVEGEMHHKQRYNKRPILNYMFYGEEMTEQEKQTARKLIKANALNFGASEYKISFYRTPVDIKERLALSQ